MYHLLVTSATFVFTIPRGTSRIVCPVIGTSHLSWPTMRIPPPPADRELKTALEDSDSITEEPGRRGRFSRAWEAMESMEKDANWVGFIGDRCLDALDDAIHRDRYIEEHSSAPSSERERIVVLGSGWGANAILSQLKNANADITVVSPRNYFLFTPMLAGAALGTLEPRSIIEPIREANPLATYFEAKARTIDPESRIVSCENVVCEGTVCEIREFDLPYDKLVVAVGASTNTFGVKGVKEHCLFLKQLSDAIAFREQLGYAFEQASLPGLTEQERVEKLTFVVIGAGPTGVELCGELRDFVAQDVPRLYKSLQKFVRIVLLEASDKVLMAFDGDLQDAALEKLRSNEQGVAIDVRLSAGVKEVTEDEIRLGDGSTIKYALSLWAAGIGTLDFVRQTAQRIPAQAEHEAQARGRLAVDAWQRVIGAPGIFAFGDCAHVVDGPLPATAQVASQAGTYLGRLLADGYRTDLDVPELPEDAPGASTLRYNLRRFGDKGQAPPFTFLNLGILAYVGKSEALVQIAVGGSGDKKVKSAGQAGFALWRSVYLSKQYGLRNRILVAVDWAKARAFGRDLSRL
mmetsp:Transcript_38110/g.81214  ORF Transcript_38110/g.81214 Transcript_38110/m.81214 type:complete len:576 (-) Transcript_38110:298-2025(-)